MSRAGSRSFGMSEEDWEIFAMDILGELAWLSVPGSSIAPGSGERESWAELILPGRLRDAVTRINPKLPASAVEDAVQQVLDAASRDALAENHRLHGFLTRGIRSVVYSDEHGAEHNPTIHLVDFRRPESNDFLATNQVTVIDGEHRRRLDIVLYLNGLPV